jgi:hypothetical protein
LPHCEPPAMIPTRHGWNELFLKYILSADFPEGIIKVLQVSRLQIWMSSSLSHRKESGKRTGGNLWPPMPPTQVQFSQCPSFFLFSSWLDECLFFLAIDVCVIPYLVVQLIFSLNVVLLWATSVDGRLKAVPQPTAGRKKLCTRNLMQVGSLWVISDVVRPYVLSTCPSVSTLLERERHLECRYPL